MHQRVDHRYFTVYIVILRNGMLGLPPFGDKIKAFLFAMSQVTILVMILTLTQWLDH
jgi:hypothetical protein